MKVKSREYKVMLKTDRFSDRRSSVDAFAGEISDLADRLELPLTGKFKSPEKRIIRFFDTADFTFRQNGFVLRRRDLHDTDQSQVTLKRRSADRYLSAGADLSTAGDFEGEEKFEEDIAAVFRSRFSHSQTVTANRSKFPQLTSIKQSTKIFPVLGLVERDGRLSPPKTDLSIVGGVVASERVYKGLSVNLGDKDASLAIILWTLGFGGRPLAAEFSFRYKSKKESYSPELALAARTFFFSIQRLDWSAADSPTKTQLVYGESP